MKLLKTLYVLAISKPLNPIIANLFVVRPTLHSHSSFPPYQSPWSIFDLYRPWPLRSTGHGGSLPSSQSPFLTSEPPLSSCLPLTSLAAPSPLPFWDFSPPPDSTCVRIPQHAALLTLFPLWTHLAPMGLNIIYILKVSHFFPYLPLPWDPEIYVRLFILDSLRELRKCLHGQTVFLILFPNIVFHR